MERQRPSASANPKPKKPADYRQLMPQKLEPWNRHTHYYYIYIYILLIFFFFSLILTRFLKTLHLIYRFQKHRPFWNQPGTAGTVSGTTKHHPLLPCYPRTPTPLPNYFVQLLVLFVKFHYNTKCRGNGFCQHRRLRVWWRRSSCCPSPFFPQPHQSAF